MCFPKAPAPVAPVIPPTPQQPPDQAMIEARKAAQQKKGFGAAATDVTTNQALTDTAVSGGKQLMGQ